MRLACELAGSNAPSGVASAARSPDPHNRYSEEPRSTSGGSVLAPQLDSTRRGGPTSSTLGRCLEKQNVGEGTRSLRGLPRAKARARAGRLQEAPAEVGGYSALPAGYLASGSPPVALSALPAARLVTQGERAMARCARAQGSRHPCSEVRLYAFGGSAVWPFCTGRKSLNSGGSSSSL